MWNNEYQNNEVHVRDGMYGVVTGSCKRGLFVELENGQEAFALFGGLYPGTEVFCTVLKKATETWRVLVAIDSVLAEPTAA